MAQVLVRPEDVQNGRFTVRGDEAHHLIRVLRKQPKDTIRIFDGQGQSYHGLLTHIDPDNLTVQGDILSTIAWGERRWRVRLFQGIPRGGKFDYVIEKATELGADEIIPFTSKKGLVRLDEAQSSSKVTRWGNVATAASKQCNRPVVTRISTPAPLAKLGDELSNGVTLTLWEEEKKSSLKDVLRALANDGGTINIVIGPEGGLAPAETEWMKTLGAKTVTLGERILRTETAGLVALSILNYELDLF